MQGTDDRCRKAKLRSELLLERRLGTSKCLHSSTRDRACFSKADGHREGIKTAAGTGFRGSCFAFAKRCTALVSAKDSSCAGRLHHSGGGKVLGAEREALCWQGEPGQGCEPSGRAAEPSTTVVSEHPRASGPSVRLFRWRKSMPRGPPGRFSGARYFGVVIKLCIQGRRWTTFGRHGRRTLFITFSEGS